MKKLLLFLFVLPLAGCLSVIGVPEDLSSDFKLNSETGLVAEIASEDGAYYYRLTDAGSVLIDWSVLGLNTDRGVFPNDAEFSGAEDYSVVDSYEAVHGKSSARFYSAQGLVLNFKKSDLDFRIRLQLSGDGLGIRYELDGDGSVKTYCELTQFNYPSGSDLWLQKMSFLPSYERVYGKYSADSVVKATYGFALPALIRNGESYVLLAESGMQRNYGVTRLQQRAGGSGFYAGFPHVAETINSGSVCSVSELPLETTWKVAVAGSAADVVESTLVEDLAQPQHEIFESVGTDWIKPGLSAWDWLVDSETDGPDIQKIYIDRAAEYGWEYVLVDANWNRWNGGDFEPVVKDLVDYAEDKGVDLFFWYNSGGNHNAVTEEPRNKMVDKDIMAAEMKWLREIGIKGIKVDFFRSDKQQRIAQYLDILEAAAKEKIMVNFHGCTAPRGLSRTYPNLVTVEGVRGAENYRKGEDSTKALESMLFVFTRNVVGPMDFTPFFLDKRLFENGMDYSYALAQTVLYESAVNHFCGAMEFEGEGYPVFFDSLPEAEELLRDLPAAWDETKFLGGAPESYVVLARRSGEQWYVSGVNGGSDSVELDTAVLLEGFTFSSVKKFFPGSKKSSVKFAEESSGDLTSIVLESGQGFILKLEN